MMSLGASYASSSFDYCMNIFICSSIYFFACAWLLSLLVRWLDAAILAYDALISNVTADLAVNGPLPSPILSVVSIRWPGETR